MQTKQHLRAVTGLRFYAALGVVLFHCTTWLAPVHGLSTVFGFGFTGVSFFFVLSGFVLAWSHSPGVTVREFYWRRFARVWPLHALTTVLSIGVALATGVALLWPALPAVLLLVQAWFPQNDVTYAFNGVSWSLSCEMFFYLLFPLIAGRIARSKPRAIGGAAFVAMVLCGVAVHHYLPAGLSGYALFALPLFRLGEFVIGICLAVMLRNGWRPRFSLTQAVLLVAALYAAITVWADTAIGGPSSVPAFIAGVWMLPGFAALIIAAAGGDLRGDGGRIRSRMAVQLGQWSFSLLPNPRAYSPPRSSVGERAHSSCCRGCHGCRCCGVRRGVQRPVCVV